MNRLTFASRYLIRSSLLLHVSARNRSSGLFNNLKSATTNSSYYCCRTFTSTTSLFNKLQNQDITFKTINLIDETGQPQGFHSPQQVLRTLDQTKYDLTIVNTQTNPPIARITPKQLSAKDKFSNEEKRRFKEERRLKKLEEKKTPKPDTNTTKEIEIKANIQPRDLEIKLKKLEGFLTKGNRVVVVISKQTIHAKRNDNTNELLEQIKDTVKHLDGSVFKDAVNEGNRVRVVFNGKFKTPK